MWCDVMWCDVLRHVWLICHWCQWMSICIWSINISINVSQYSIWYDMVWYDMIRCCIILYYIKIYDVLFCSVTSCDKMIWYDMIFWCDVIWLCDLTWRDITTSTAWHWVLCRLSNNDISLTLCITICQYIGRMVTELYTKPAARDMLR